MKNEKTYYTVDFTTNCPKRQAGHPCPYCYVEAKRDIGFHAKKIIDSIEYNDEIENLTQEKIDKLNSLGGVRLFSFGDYMPEQDDDIYQFLCDCRAVGLYVKVITKQLSFIDKFYDEFEDVFSTIHISVDNIHSGVDWNDAK
jgi:hypothetical protein